MKIREMSKLSTKRVNIIVLVVSFIVIKVGFYHAVMLDMSRQSAIEFYERYSHLLGEYSYRLHPDTRGFSVYEQRHLTLAIVFFAIGLLIYLGTNKNVVPKRHYALMLLAITSLVGSFGYSNLYGYREWHFSGLAFIFAECTFALFEHVKLLKNRNANHALPPQIPENAHE